VKLNKLFGSIALLLTAACASTAGNTMVGDATGQSEILVGHGGLADDLQIKNLRTRTRNELLVAEVDQEGFQIPSAVRHWSPAELSVRSLKAVTGVAPRPGAGSFKLHVRFPQEIE